MAKKKQGKVARFKIQRRLGAELPGLGKAGALERRPYPPGENGNRRRKFSDFALRLEEKQKIRFHYGLREEQLRRFIRDAKSGHGNWVEKLMGRLECRLDNTIFRLGFATSIRAAKQLVSHGHVLVDGNRVNISSYVLKTGQKVSLKKKALENQIVIQATQSPRLELPDYLRKEDQEGQPVGVIHAIPGIEHVPFSFDAGLFTEFYAAKQV